MLLMDYRGGPRNGQVFMCPSDPPKTIKVPVAPDLPWDRWSAEAGAFIYGPDETEMVRSPLPSYKIATYELKRDRDGDWTYVWTGTN
jgi:hypothetical protein